MKKSEEQQLIKYDVGIRELFKKYSFLTEGEKSIHLVAEVDLADHHEKEKREQENRIHEQFLNSEATQKRGLYEFFTKYKCYKCHNKGLKYLHTKLTDNASAKFMEFIRRPIDHVSISSVCKSVLKHDLIMAQLRSPQTVFEIFGFIDYTTCGHNQYTHNFTLSNCRVIPKSKRLLCKDCFKTALNNAEEETKNIIRTAVPPLEFIEKHILIDAEKVTDSKIATFYLLKHSLASSHQPLLRGIWRNLVLGNEDCSFVTELLVELTAPASSPHCPCDELEFILSYFFERKKKKKLHLGYELEEMLVFADTYLYLRLNFSCHTSIFNQYNSFESLNSMANENGLGSVTLHHDGNMTVPPPPHHKQLSKSKSSKSSESTSIPSVLSQKDLLANEFKRIRELQKDQAVSPNSIIDKEKSSLGGWKAAAILGEGKRKLDAMFSGGTTIRNNKTSSSSTKKNSGSLTNSNLDSAPTKLVIREPTIRTKDNLCEALSSRITFKPHPKIKQLSLAKDYYIKIKLLSTASNGVYFGFPKSNNIIPPPIIRRTSFNTFEVIPNISNYYDSIVERTDIGVVSIDQNEFYRSIVGLVNLLKRDDVNDNAIRFKREVPADTDIPFTKNETDNHKLNPDTITQAIWNIQGEFKKNADDKSSGGIRKRGGKSMVRDQSPPAKKIKIKIK